MVRVLPEDVEIFLSRVIERFVFFFGAGWSRHKANLTFWCAGDIVLALRLSAPTSAAQAGEVHWPNTGKAVSLQDKSDMAAMLQTTRWINAVIAIDRFI